MFILVAMQTLIFLATVVFVAVQTDRITRTLKLSAHQDVLNNLHRLDELLIGNPELATVFQETSGEIEPRHRTFLYFVFNLFDSLYSKVHLGIVDYRTWNPWRNWLISLAQHPKVKQFWADVAARGLYTEPFIRFANDAFAVPADNSPYLSIVVPFHGDPAVLSGCLQTVKQYASDKVEIIVVADGMHGVEFQDLIKASQPDCRVINIPRGGPARARNEGLWQTHGHYVLFLDADAELTPGTVERLHQVIEQAGEVAAVQAVPIAATRNLIGRHEEAEYWTNYVRSTEDVLDVEQVHTHCAIYRRQVLTDIGGFNEDFHRPGGEDTDLAYRIRNLGLRLCIATGAIVRHHNSTNLGSSGFRCERRILPRAVAKPSTACVADSRRRKKQAGHKPPGACGLPGVRPWPRLSASYSPRPGLVLRLPAAKAGTPDGRVVPEPGTVRGTS